MSTAGEFTRISGEHYVTVPAGNINHTELIGVRGKLLASGSVARILVQFDGHESELEMSAFDVVEYTGDDSCSNESETGSGPNVGIYFGTETGNTEIVAEQIRDQLTGVRVTAFKDIANCSVGELLQHDVLLLGVSTWNIGDIQYNWEEKLDEIEAQDYSGIRVGIFGLGDAAGYPDTFVDGMGILWDRMKGQNAELIGLWPIDGYDFDESKGLFDSSNFLGVVIDEDGEAEKTSDRIKAWVAQLHAELGITAS